MAIPIIPKQMLIRQRILFLHGKKGIGRSIVHMLQRKLLTNVASSNIHRGSLKDTISGIAISRTATTTRKDEERYSCWCFLYIDEVMLEAKIVHKGRGKFKILNDEFGGRYINKIVDASDIVRCIVEI